MPRASAPLVALESTVIAHGLPHPENERAALTLEAAVREEGAQPRTIGLIGGEPVVGLSEAQIRRLATAKGVRKVSLRDLPVAVAQALDGATTVAATLHLAHRAGLRVFATGGIGGVHRTASGRSSWDVSADLDALARYPLVVVCAGAKAILDLEATREALETRGVTVVGYGCDTLPAFYSRATALPVDVRCDTPEEVAALARAHGSLGLPAALLVTVPPPQSKAIPTEEIEPVIAQTVDEAAALGLRSAEVTPFLLRRLGTLTGGRTLGTNLALLEQNARVAARIAVALVRER